MPAMTANVGGLLRSSETVSLWIASDGDFTRSGWTMLVNDSPAVMRISMIKSKLFDSSDLRTLHSLFRIPSAFRYIDAGLLGSNRCMPLQYWIVTTQARLVI